MTDLQLGMILGSLGLVVLFYAGLLVHLIVRAIKRRRRRRRCRRRFYRY